MIVSDDDLPWSRKPVGNIAAALGRPFDARLYDGAPTAAEPRPAERARTHLDYALAYAALGLRVFPLAERSKVPRAGSAGVKDATTDADQIRAWWTASPSANIGIAMGDGLLAIDVDVKRGAPGAESWERLSGQHAPPDTWHGMTPTGGAHFLYRVPRDVVIRNRAGKLAPGIDLRYAGGYILAEPSIHPETGTAYAWEGSSDPLEGAALADLPASLLALVVEPPEPEPAPAGAGATTHAAAARLPEGSRNDTLARLAGVARGAGLDMDGTRRLVEFANAELFTSPLDPREIESTVLKSAAKWEAVAPAESGSLETLTGAVALSREPEPRPWLAQDWIPLRQTSALYAEGGSGKTLAAQQLLYSAVSGQPWLGIPLTRTGPALGVFCEDEPAELERRLHDIVSMHGGIADGLGDLHMISRVGADNLLMTFDRDVGTLTPFWYQLRATVERIRPVVLVVDTASDTFGGNEIIRPQVRQFIQRALTALAIEFDLAVMLLAHPSSAGSRSGSGDGGSTGWNATVRSRLYLETPEGAAFSTLTRKKSNYAKKGESIEIAWHGGCFIPRVNAEEMEIPEQPEQEDPQEHSAAVDAAFIRLLRLAHDRGTHLSPKPTANNNIIGYLVSTQRRYKYTYTRADYSSAFERLRASGQVFTTAREVDYKIRDVVLLTGYESPDPAK